MNSEGKVLIIKSMGYVNETFTVSHRTVWNNDVQ